MFGESSTLAMLSSLFPPTTHLFPPTSIHLLPPINIHLFPTTNIDLQGNKDTGLLS